MLVGPTIENRDKILSEHGSVLLAAGQKVTITSPDAECLRFELQAPSDSAVNVGSIAAASSAGMFAGTLRHSGDIRATAATLAKAARSASSRRRKRSSTKARRSARAVSMAAA